LDYGIKYGFLNFDEVKDYFFKSGCGFLYEFVDVIFVYKSELEWMCVFCYKLFDYFNVCLMFIWGGMLLLYEIDFENIFYYIKLIVS